MQPIKKLNELINMESTKKASPISGRALQLIIGILAFLLPLTLIIGAAILDDCQLVQNSISAYYHTIMRDFFVGTLCAVGVSMFAYYGFNTFENRVANVAALAALGVAFFPTSVGEPATDCLKIPIENGIISTFHFISAGLLFSLLAFFSLVLFTKTGGDMTSRKKIRNKIYNYCGYLIIICIVAIAIYSFLPENIVDKIEDYKPVFYLEALALGSFSISWLTKGEAFLGDK